MAAADVNRKGFMTTLGCIGAGACVCGAVMGFPSAFGAESPRPVEPEGETAERTPTKPGEQSAARAAKRMEFVDAWIPRFFLLVDDHLDEPTRKRLMAANGKACFSAYAPDMKRRPEPATPETIAKWVANRGEAAGYAMDGDTVVMEYVGSAETGQSSPEGICLCPAVEAQKAGTISPTYCWCSVGYVKEMHERIFGRTVNVDLVHSVLTGQKRCRFRITLA
jgi:hypothetical protein